MQGVRFVIRSCVTRKKVKGKCRKKERGVRRLFHPFCMKGPMDSGIPCPKWAHNMQSFDSATRGFTEHWSAWCCSMWMLSMHNKYWIFPKVWRLLLLTWRVIHIDLTLGDGYVGCVSLWGGREWYLLGVMHTFPMMHLRKNRGEKAAFYSKYSTACFIVVANPACCQQMMPSGLSM